jgi:hypothetical protein
MRSSPSSTAVIVNQPAYGSPGDDLKLSECFEELALRSCSMNLPSF